IYTLWPNGHYLRVNLNTLGRSNIFTKLLGMIYAVDTSTNVFPSIHVYNSIGAMIAIRTSEKLRPIKWLQISALILTILICMSTVFLKQHSILDVFGGIILSIIMYGIVYVPDKKLAKKTEHELSNV
ncbi:MAG: phosphatase PAP2 family protein, partial [Clostridiales bacterium]|nr:phosphatase PAP2 family protein [Clostridiales bacterium]